MNELLGFNILFGGRNVRTVPSILIMDISLPTYQCWWSTNSNGTDTITSANEGTTVYFIIKANGIIDFDSCFITILTITNSEVAASRADFNNPSNDPNAGYLVSGTANFNNNNIAYLAVQIKNDSISEGVEHIYGQTIINHGGIGGVGVESAKLIINDTSQDPPNYDIRILATESNTQNTISNINEGVQLNVYCTYYQEPVGKNFTIELSGNNITAADFTDNTLTKTATTVSGGYRPNSNANYKPSDKLVSTLTKWNIKNDDLTEGNETLTVKIKEGSSEKASATVTIIDTSGNLPTYAPMWASTTTGTTEITSVNESSTAWLHVTTTNLPNNTTLRAVLSGNGITAADFTDNTLTKDIVITGNKGKTSWGIRADQLTEGAETIIATIYNGNNAVATKNLVINDISLTPINEVYVTNDMWGEDRTTTVDWGEDLYLVVRSDHTSGSVTITFDSDLTGYDMEYPTNLNLMTVNLTPHFSGNGGWAIQRIRTRDVDDASMSNNKWKDLTSSRALNTTYYNDTDETIWVAVMIWHSENNVAFSSISVDGQRIEQYGGHADDATLYYSYTLHAEVAPGESYRVDSEFYLSVWSELRP